MIELIIGVILLWLACGFIAFLITLIIAKHENSNQLSNKALISEFLGGCLLLGMIALKIVIQKTFKLIDNEKSK